MDNGPVSKPDIVVGNDMLGTMISKSLDTLYVPFRREYHPDGAPKPKVDLRYEVTDYETFNGKKVMTVYRRSMLPDRDAVARHFTNYTRLVRNLTNKKIFNSREVDVIYPYWISGRADHNPRTDPDDEVRRRDKGGGLEYENDAIFFKAAGAKRLLTFHPHFHREFGIGEIGGLEVVFLDAVPSMVEYAKKEYGLDQGDWLVVNPDLKPSRKDYDIALAFANVAGLPSDHLKMDRSSGSTKIAQGGPVEAKGRNVIIVDDIGSTFGTLETAVRHIKEPGKLYAMLVHPVMPMEGLQKLTSMLRDTDCPLRDVAGTHTIDSDISLIPIHREISEFYNGSQKYVKEA